LEEDAGNYAIAGKTNERSRDSAMTSPTERSSKLAEILPLSSFDVYSLTKDREMHSRIIFIVRLIAINWIV